MRQSIEVVVRNVYGRELIYPINEDANIFARIAGTKTLKRDHIELIKALGYTVTKLTDEVTV